MNDKGLEEITCSGTRESLGTCRTHLLLGLTTDRDAFPEGGAEGTHGPHCSLHETPGDADVSAGVGSTLGCQGPTAPSKSDNPDALQEMADQEHVTTR